MKRGRRTKRRIRRGQLKPMEAYTSKRNRLTVRDWWYRQHPTYSKFSYGRQFRKGKRRK